MKEGSRLRRRESALVCSFCHDRVAETARACPACGTVLHRECWLEGGSCPTLGCAESVVRPSELLEATPPSQGFAYLEEQWQVLAYRSLWECLICIVALLGMTQLIVFMGSR